MWPVCKKELQQFFSSLTGYIAITFFLLLTGAILFILPDNIFDFGYATLEKFFKIAPWILLILIPAITMRSFADEFKTGTYETLQTLPITRWQLINGKYFAALIVVLIAIIPTIVYPISLQQLSATGGIDTGGTTGSYIGLILLSACFVAISICCSSLTNNAVVAFISSAFLCVLVYGAFAAISRIPAFEGGADYWLEMLGIDFHYQSISRGVIDTRDLVYFLSVIIFFLIITHRNLVKR
ncbi:MAG: ABC transporter permease subunit [Chitinophagaceae bacterium]|nr:ABC transporter permease subunit [Chitinophagaceae bacterium]